MDLMRVTRGRSDKTTKVDRFKPVPGDKGALSVGDSKPVTAHWPNLQWVRLLRCWL